MAKRLFFCLLMFVLLMLPFSSFSEESVPPHLTFLYNYFLANESTSTYAISERPRYFALKYQMELRDRDVPDCNGVAVVETDSESSMIKIEFQYTSFLGIDSCSPQLVKSVCKTAVQYALAADNYEGDKQSVIDDVINSYRDGSYGETVFAGQIAFVFEPSDSCMTIFHVIDIRTVAASIENVEYEEGSYAGICSGLNAGELYYVSGKVTSLENGYVRTLFGKTYCIKASVIGTDGNLYCMIVKPETYPCNFKVGDEGIFYGNVSSYTSGEPSLWIDYFNKIR